MSHLIACDGCGEIVSDRPEDPDPLGAWWSLTQGPTFGGRMLLESIDLDLTMDDEHPWAMTEPAAGEDVPTERERHFCTLDCLLAWGERTTGRAAP